jgi:hypothetical protein
MLDCGRANMPASLCRRGAFHVLGECCGFGEHAKTAAHGCARAQKLNAFATQTVQVTSEAAARPIITAFTMVSASWNMPQGERSCGRGCYGDGTFAGLSARQGRHCDASAHHPHKTASESPRGTAACTSRATGPGDEACEPRPRSRHPWQVRIGRQARHRPAGRGVNFVRCWRRAVGAGGHGGRS